MPCSEIVTKTFGMKKSSEIVAFLSPRLAPLRISFDDIVSATNNFANDNFISRGNFSDVYKGKLLWSKVWIDVVIRRYLPSLKLGESEFLKEIQEHSELNHRNTLSIVGFCDENGEKIMVFEYQHNGSLDRYLSDPSALTWSHRLKICLGAASLLRYIHEDMEVRLSHGFDHEIKSSKILLDRDWEAKVFCFGFHMGYDINLPYSKSSYTDPEHNRSHMSDVYSFGVILFEVICGKKAEVKDGCAYESFKQHYEKGNLDDIINPDLRKQMHPISLSILSEIAYSCLQEGKKRPRMNLIVEGLQQALELPFIFEKEYAYLKIPFSDVMLATKNFDTTYCVGSQSDVMLYKAQLDHYDINSLLTIEGKNKQLPKMHGEVIIKRNISINHGQVAKGFIKEIKMLAGCTHSNIVSLLGFSWEGCEMILVYESPFNGSLDDYLGSSSKTTNLTWEQRIQICHDIAFGLKYLHCNQKIIHQGICSANVLLDEKWNAKIANFRLSKLKAMYTELMADTYVKSDRKSNVYSFGVILFEILCGRLAHDSIYIDQNDKGLAPIARQHFIKRTFKKLVDPKIMEEVRECTYTTKKGPAQDSLDTFARIACQCLSESEDQRPTEEVIIKSLEKALRYQENRKDTLNISLEDIRFDGETFSDNSCNISRGLGMVYNGEGQYNNGCKAVAVKRLRRSGLEPGVWREFEIPFKHRHENIVGLVGYCKKMDEKFIVYEHSSNQSLDLYLNDADFSWTKRLKICIHIANGLDFLHRCDVGPEVVIHRDMKSSNILLTGDWKAKISGFEVSLICPINQEIGYAVNDVVGSPGYCDPLYWDKHFLTKESYIYSFGVILFEVLCGRLACHKDSTYPIQFLDDLVKHQHGLGRLEDIVFDGIKEQILRESFLTFRRIAIQCLHDEIKERPTAGAVLEQLQKALEFQEAFEIWENKLPTNYIEILKLSNSPEIYSTMGKKDIYNMFSEGISLQDGKLWFSIGSNGERNEMISARTFSYKSRWSHRWRSIQESRFGKVAEVSDITNLNIQIKKSTQLLLPGVNYSVHLVFKFCCPRKSHAHRVYVNLKYKMGNQNLNAYFATWRRDGWMMIELCRFSNQKDETNVDVLLESFSRCYCDSRAIYIEGIEFQALDNVKQEEFRKSEKIQQVSNSEMDKSSSSMRTKVAAEQVLYDTSNRKLSLSNLSLQSRSEGRGIKLLTQQVFRIKCNIGSQMESPNTNGVCYLVFKLSESCNGLHCPVIIRDQSNWRSKETGILYFRSPSPWNLVATDRVPKKRGDGWMEVKVGIFNSDCRFLNLKLITYEGTMSGLILRGLEFRPS